MAGKYYIFHMDKKAFAEVDGEPVSFEGYEDLDLFLHRPIGAEDGWRISEGRTGLFVTGYSQTPEEAKENARQKCHRIEKRVATIVDKHVSPRYKLVLKDKP